MRFRPGVLPALVAAGLAVLPALESSDSSPWSRPGAERDSTAPRLTAERIFSDPPLVRPAPTGIQWLPDSRGVTYLTVPAKGEDVPVRFVMREVPSGRERTLCIVDTTSVPADLKRGETDTLRIRSYEWAPKGDLMKFHFRDELFTFNRKSGEFRRRTRNDEPEENSAFSPDGRMIAFTRESDLWVLDLDLGVETRLTSSGSDSLYNGVLDWVYEEELFSRGNRRGFWWSPDGRKIAYLQFDERGVPAFPIVDFLPVRNTIEHQFYPKPGDPLPVVRAGVVDLSSLETTWLDLDTRDHSYLARLDWLGDSARLAVQKLNRAQDRLALSVAHIQTGEASEILIENSGSWVDVTDATHFYATKDRFVWSSDRDGYSHLYLYTDAGALVRRVTKGRWGVSGLDAVDEKRGALYFTGLEKSPIERHLYRVSEEGGTIERITRREGTHSVTFSPDNRFYFDQFSSVTEPRLITVHASSGKELFTLDRADAALLAEYDLPIPEFFTFTSDGGAPVQCSMIKPRDFDPTKKYPVLIYTYGFPNGQVVRNRWGGSTALWHSSMAQRGFIVFSLDGRGSAGYGKAWASAALDTIGLAALADHIAAAAHLGSLPWADASRIGIWGWSGGGTMTALAMLKTPGVFRAGAAVAPVTDWRFYDAIYTERYMKLPADNESGYREASPANFAARLDGAFLIAHGTADDNVHVQNSIYLVRELIAAGKDFDFMVYPGGRHGIGGDKARSHLYTRLTRFFEENL